MAILAACEVEPQTVADLAPVIFKRPIDDPHQLVFAFSEALAHVNLLVRDGRLRLETTKRGVALKTIDASGLAGLSSRRTSHEAATAQRGASFDPPSRLGAPRASRL